MATAFADRLDSLARSRRLGNRPLAERIGDVTHATVGSWRRGESEPRVEHLARLAEVLGVGVEFLITGREPTPGDLPDDERFVLDAYRSARGEGLTAHAVVMLIGAAVDRAAAVGVARPGDAVFPDQGPAKAPRPSRRRGSA